MGILHENVSKLLLPFAFWGKCTPAEMKQMPKLHKPTQRTSVNVSRVSLTSLNASLAIFSLPQMSEKRPLSPAWLSKHGKCQTKMAWQELQKTSVALSQPYELFKGPPEKHSFARSTSPLSCIHLKPEIKEESTILQTQCPIKKSIRLWSQSDTVAKCCRYPH